ncbi:MAG: type III glutamate--ammonia ligase [Cyanobium sp.]|jgi:glutamine synthetase type III
MSSLAEAAAAQGFAFVLFSFTDLFGVQRAKLVPAPALDALEQGGAGFAGFAAWLDLSPARADLLAFPDPRSLMALPGQPEVAWVATDLVLDGEPLAHCPRGVLQRQVQRAGAQGLQFRTGVEPEFFLLNGDGTALADGHDQRRKPCYDQLALMRHYPLISELLSALQGLGWGPYQADHEDANGQFEINWTFDDALVTADRHAFFRFLVPWKAEAHGLSASFRPRPFADLTGNGCHLHHSLWDASGKNLFHDPASELELSATARHFLGGVLAHAPALCAFTNPTAASYRRLAGASTTSGATWSPAWISWGANNRTHMVRVPDGQRLELRLADGDSNPYLLPAVVLAAGLDGLERQLDPGPFSLEDLHAAPPSNGRPLPRSQGEALAALSADGVLREALGEAFCQSYERMLPQRSGPAPLHHNQAGPTGAEQI